MGALKVILIGLGIGTLRVLGLLTVKLGVYLLTIVFFAYLLRACSASMIRPESNDMTWGLALTISWLFVTFFGGKAKK